MSRRHPPVDVISSESLHDNNPDRFKEKTLGLPVIEILFFFLKV